MTFQARATLDDVQIAIGLIGGKIIYCNIRKCFFMVEVEIGKEDEMIRLLRFHKESINLVSANKKYLEETSTS